MTWITKVPRPAPPHDCKVPGARQIYSDDAGLGSVWECDDCGRRHEMVENNNSIHGYRWRPML